MTETTETQIGPETWAADTDYRDTRLISTSPDEVFAALTTLEGLAGWWAPVTGSALEGGRLRFVFGAVDPVVKDIRVDRAERASVVEWTVLDCNALPEWVGTRACFRLQPGPDGGCELQFRHHGLAPQLDCFDSCRAGWDQFLASLQAYVEQGQGFPYGG